MSRKKIWWSVGVVAVVALLVIVGLIFAPMLRSRATLDDCSALVPYDQLTAKGHLVVRGRIVDGGKNIREDGGAGDDWLYTEYTLQVTNTLRGKADEKVKVRIDGGYTFTHEYDCTGCPEIHKGDEVVAFLYRPEGQTGDYYRIQGGRYTGWYQADGDTLIGYGNTKRSYRSLIQDLK